MMNQILIVAHGVILHSLRQKESQLLGVIACVLVLCGLSARLLLRPDEAITGTFILQLGLSFVFIAAQFFTLLTAARQLPEEMDQRTIMPLLAKPLSRGKMLCGKWLGAAALGIGAVVILAPLWTLVGPRTETYEIATFIQAIAIQICALSAVAALGVGLSTVFPLAISLGIGALLIVKPALITTALHTVFAHSPVEFVGNFLNVLYPRFTFFDFSAAYCGGVSPTDLTDCAARVLYAVIWTVLPLVLGTLIFARKRL